MTSILLDKLEILKSNEIKIKEEQRFLVEQISLEMEKKKRLKKEGTLQKLEVQVDELAENFDNVLMPNNFEAVLYKMEQDLNKDRCEYHDKYPNRHERRIESYAKITERESSLYEKKSKYQRHKNEQRKITLGEFQRNLDLIGEETKATLLKSGGLHQQGYKTTLEIAKEQLLIKPEMKIYSDIVPLFRTMIGIMEKQQREIDELKSKFFKN